MGRIRHNHYAWIRDCIHEILAKTSLPLIWSMEVLVFCQKLYTSILAEHSKINKIQIMLIATPTTNSVTTETGSKSFQQIGNKWENRRNKQINQTPVQNSFAKYLHWAHFSSLSVLSVRLITLVKKWLIRGTMVLKSTRLPKKVNDAWKKVKKKTHKRSLQFSAEIWTAG